MDGVGNVETRNCTELEQLSYYGSFPKTVKLLPSGLEACCVYQEFISERKHAILISNDTELKYKVKPSTDNTLFYNFVSILTKTT